jgi:sortase (surface protein transpeptidase)
MNQIIYSFIIIIFFVFSSTQKKKGKKHATRETVWKKRNEMTINDKENRKKNKECHTNKKNRFNKSILKYGVGEVTRSRED